MRLTNLRTLRLALLPLFLASELHAQTAPSRATLNLFSSAACQEAIGVDCATDPSQASLWSNIRVFVNSQPVGSITQTVIVQKFLVPLINQNASMKQDIVTRAFQALGRTATYADQNQWIASYNSWQTYQRLVPMIPRTGVSPVVAPTAPQYTQAQQQQALQTAFVKVWARQPLAAEAARFNSIAPAAMESAVRGLLAGTPAEASRIVDGVFAPVIGRQPTAYEKAGVVGAFGRYWTGADDLASYLRGVSASYRTPNNGPQQVTGIPFSNGQIFIGFNGIPLSTSLLGAGGYLLAIDGNSIVAQGGGNLISSNGILVDRNGSPLVFSKIVAQGGGNLVSQGGGNIVAQGGGNIVAQGGGNIVAQGGGNIVAQGGGNLQPLVNMGSFGLYDAVSIANLLRNPVSLTSIGAELTKAVNLLNSQSSGTFGLQSVGAPTQTAADAGDGNAMFLLAISCWKLNNLIDTYKWFSLASVHTGSLTTPAYKADVNQFRTTVWSLMTATQQAQGNASVASWQQAHPGR